MNKIAYHEETYSLGGYSAGDYSESRRFKTFEKNFDSNVKKSIKKLTVDSFNETFYDGTIDAAIASEIEDLKAQNLVHINTIYKLSDQTKKTQCKLNIERYLKLLVEFEEKKLILEQEIKAEEMKVEEKNED